jgi:hypothetical protein
LTGPENLRAVDLEEEAEETDLAREVGKSGAGGCLGLKDDRLGEEKVEGGTGKRWVAKELIARMGLSSTGDTACWADLRCIGHGGAETGAEL